MVELEVDCFVVLPSVMYERLGRIQNGGIIVLLSAAFVGNWWGHVSGDAFTVSLAVSAHPKVSNIDQ